ncbi:MAG: hypothetical protein Q9196_006555 [Gyalolechia fulgens]
MEVSSLHPTFSPQTQGFSYSSTATVGIDDMEMDVDFDLGPVDTASPGALIPDVSELNNAIDLPAGVVVPHKVHIKGVDDLTTDDLRTFAAEHHPTDVPIRIDWIDDTSANFVYNTPASAMEALNTFSLQPFDREAASTPLLHLRSAKAMASHPEARLQVRIALSTDVKRSRAYEASRFYMMHPEYDPREKSRGQKDGGGRFGYRRRCYIDNDDRRKRIRAREKTYNASMYDEDSGSLADAGFASRRGSISMRSNGSSPVDVHSDRGSHYRTAQRGDFYRPGSKRERKSSRTRSASPDRGEDSHSTSNRWRSRQRTRTGNRSKELLSVTAGAQKPSSSSKELFPNKSVAANLKKELFPTKTGNAQHRRPDAFEAADETAELFATGMALSSGDPSARKTSTAVDVSYGRLRKSDPEPQYDPHDPSVDVGVNIRGASEHQDTGVSILGAAQKSHVGTIRELFPSKAGNSGKELFAERLRGRSLQRNKAEDLFY